MRMRRRLAGTIALIVVCVVLVLLLIFADHFQEDQGMETVESGSNQVNPSEVRTNDTPYRDTPSETLSEVVSIEEGPSPRGNRFSIGSGDGEITYSRIEPIPGYLSESVDFLMAMRRHPEIEVTDEELYQLMEVYVDIVRLRAAHEASICQVEKVDDFECNITIPLYAEKGIELINQMYQQFEDVVGKQRADLMQVLLNSEFYARSYGFGKTEQRINVRLVLFENPLHEPGYEFWREVDGYSFEYYDPESDSMRASDFGSAGYGSNLRISGLRSYKAFIEYFPVGG